MSTEYISKSIKELKELARESKIKGYAKMKKKELVQKLHKMDQADSSAEASSKKDSARGASEVIKESKSATAMYDSQEQICEAKYSTGFCRPSFSEENFSFPRNYGKENIVLIVRDPYWLYTYWNITEGKFSQIRSQYGDEVINNSRLTLRVKEISGKSPDSPNESFDIYPPMGTANWYVNVSKPNSSYCVEVGLLLVNNEFILIARSNVVHVPLFGPSDVVDEKWASLVDFEKIYALSGGFDVGKSSGELRKEMIKRLEQALFSGGSGAISSFGKSKEISGGKEKTFFLVVNTELIVYGQTVPSAALTIQGKEQKLNPDGTFSVRFALPEGVQNIPVTSVSEDREDTITITPVVTKETK